MDDCKCQVPPHAHKIHGYAMNPRATINWLTFVSFNVYHGTAYRQFDRALLNAVGKRPHQMSLSTRGVRTIYWSFHTKEQAEAAADRLRAAGARKIKVIPGRDLPDDQYPNPIDPNTRILLMGTALVGTAVAIAALLVAKKATASTTSTTTTGVALDATDAGNTQNLVNVGQTITISLEANASQGFGYPAPTVAATPNGVLSAPTRSTSATGISDTFTVLAAGSATITYTETTPTGAATPTVFTVTAS
jgi:hypothetical protein